MLEFAVIKTAPQSSETPSQGQKKPVDRKENDGQEFEAEYEAATEEQKDGPEEANARTNDRDGAGRGDGSKEANSKKEAVAEDDKPQPEVAVAAADDAEFSPDAEVGSGKKAPTQMGADPGLAKQNIGNTESGTRAKGGDEVFSVSGKEKTAATSGAETKATPDKTSGPAAKSPAETIIMSKVAAQPETAKKAGEGIRKAAETPVTPRATDATAPQVNAPVRVKALVEAKATAGETSDQVRNSRADDAMLRRMDTPVEAPKPPQSPLQSALGQQAAVVLAQAGNKADATREKLDVVSVVSGDLDGLGATESRSPTNQIHGTQLAQVLARAETPLMIARQMAEALQRLPDKPVEISLNPRELGRVRMSISAAEAGITVSVLAERPETLDLMRRNIEELTREFRDIGYEDINFAFAEGEANESFSDEQADETDSSITRLELAPEEPADMTSQLLSVATGVDIRL